MASVSATPRSAPSYHTQNGRLTVSPPSNHRMNSTSSSSGYAPLLRSPSRQRSLTQDAPPSFPHHPGCVLCGLVASAASQSNQGSAVNGGSSNGNTSAPSSPADSIIPLPSPIRASTPDLQRAGPTSPAPVPPSSTAPRSPRLQPRQPPPEIIIGNHRIIYRDEDVTIYPAEGKEALCRDGRHLIIVLNRHLTSVYELGSSDVPMISKIINTVQRLLLERAASSASASEAERGYTAKNVRVGFVNGMPADPMIPYPHLHAQAFLGPFDKKLPGSTLWRRNVVFNSFNWWALEDLRAEIREESSNCRVKSGYDERHESPLDKVPDAGAYEGLPNALDPDAYVDDPTLEARKALSRGIIATPIRKSTSAASSPETVRGSGEFSPKQLSVDTLGTPHRVLVGRTPKSPRSPTSLRKSPLQQTPVSPDLTRAGVDSPLSPTSWRDVSSPVDLTTPI